jgi:hypothetical protein
MDMWDLSEKIIKNMVLYFNPCRHKRGKEDGFIGVNLKSLTDKQSLDELRDRGYEGNEIS